MKKILTICALVMTMAIGTAHAASAAKGSKKATAANMYQAVGTVVTVEGMAKAIANGGNDHVLVTGRTENGGYLVKLIAGESQIDAVVELNGKTVTVTFGDGSSLQFGV